MNIPDVDLVIVYGVPKNMSEMYQVFKHSTCSSLLYNYVLSYSYLGEQVEVVVYRELTCFIVNRKRKWMQRLKIFVITRKIA